MESAENKENGAAGIKEEDSDLHKSGKYEDVRRCYKQVLDLLTGETSLTGEKKEKRDKLVLTAHLNLAGCELKLGDNKQVIEHCNQVLQMDKDRFEAYFTRAQAYYAGSEYRLAVEDLKIASELQPQNEEFMKLTEKWLKELTMLTKVDSTLEQHGAGLVASNTQQAGATGGKDCTEDEDDLAEYHDLEEMNEVGVEEATLRDHIACRKIERHSEYIPAYGLSKANLPAHYNTPEMVAIVKDLVPLTVLLKVRRTGHNRPKYIIGTQKKYPLSGKSGIHSGTGVVKNVHRYPESANQECPCTDCEKSGQRRKEFAEITIETAAHVICNLQEGKNSVCYFDYNTDQTDLASCRKLNRAVDILCSAPTDTCLVTFVTHDLKWAEKLETRILDCIKMKKNVNRNFGIDIDGLEQELPLKYKLDKLYQRCEEMMKRAVECREKYYEIRRVGLIKMLEDHMSKYPGKASCLYLRFLWTSFCTPSTMEDQGRLLEYLYQVLSQNLEQIRYIMTKYPGNTMELDSYHAEGLYQEVSAILDTSHSSLLYLEVCLNISSVDESDKRGGRDVDNALTIIVSHPHGFCKKISIGETTNRILQEGRTTGVYKYNNITCRGASGAPVYILGGTSPASTLPHSKMVYFFSSQSGAGF